MDTIYTLIVNPFLVMLHEVGSFIPTLVTTVVILVVGLLVAKGIHYVLDSIFKEVPINKFADKIGLTSILHKGGIKKKTSDLISYIVYLLTLIMFLIMAVKHLGVGVMDAFLDRLFAYVPIVLGSVMVLVLGMLIAKIIGKIVYVVANNFDIPNAKLYDRIAKWAIVLYALTIFVEELGYGALFVGTTFHILFAGLVFAVALAYGLAGQNVASKFMPKK